MLFVGTTNIHCSLFVVEQFHVLKDNYNKKLKITPNIENTVKRNSDSFMKAKTLEKF